MYPRRLMKCAAHQARQDGATAITTRRRHCAARSVGVSALSIERRCRSVVWDRKKVRSRFGPKISRYARYLGSDQDILVGKISWSTLPALEDLTGRRPRPRRELAVTSGSASELAGAHIAIYLRCTLDLKFDFRFTFLPLKCSKNTPS